MPRKQDDSRFFSADVCAFCGIDEDNEILYGKYITSDGISLHTNCMFFASGLSQRGRRETDGIVGFLLPDIETELRRGKKLFCSYCRKKGATVGCGIAKCKKSFHLACGIEHKSLHQFFGTFSSFCKDHRPRQKNIEMIENMLCHICQEDILPDNLDSCLYSPCCKHSWFHKICLQKYALSAGSYFFKCPLCNNTKQFVKEMQIHGINIPKKDASWELEENAFGELLFRPECDASVCQCVKGRNYDSGKNSVWTLFTCCYCGSHARHKICGEMEVSATTWVCPECISVEEKISVNDSKVSSVSDLDDSIEQEPCLEHSTSEETLSIVSETDYIGASSTVLSTSSSSPSSFNIAHKSDDILETESLVIYSRPVRNKDIFVNVDTKHHTSNIKCSIKHTSDKLEPSKGFELPKDIVKKNMSNVKKFASNVVKSSKISLQHKPVINLKDIKNLTPNALNALKQSSATIKPLNVKKIKRKKTEHICSSSMHCCIRKYFVQDSGKYRL